MPVFTVRHRVRPQSRGGVHISSQDTGAGEPTEADQANIRKQLEKLREQAERLQADGRFNVHEDL